MCKAKYKNDEDFIGAEGSKAESIDPFNAASARIAPYAAKNIHNR